MTNRDVIDLFRRLPEGAEVVIEETASGVFLPPLLL
jgi:lipoprotein-anchoring transpeptidase ErfK/SrfK